MHRFLNPHKSAVIQVPMATDFSFEQPSDEEVEYEENDDSEEEEHEVDEDNEDADPKPRTNKKPQSPWDFSSYSESVADEHSHRRTTSIDFKISKARQQLSAPIAKPIEEDSDSDDSEPHRQEEYRPDDEDGDDDVDTHVEKKPFFASSEGVTFHANSFIELHISRPLLRACEALGYSKPTPIQAACIPLALTGRDICGSAITGSGKTAAFALPTLERLLYRPKNRPAIRVLILTPTRELAVQVHSMIGKLAQFMPDIRCCLVVGGLSTKVQEAALRTMPDIVVATPGRMIDHLRNSMSVDLDDLAVLILDEADRLLELGFSAEIRELVRLCPKRRQTMLFSATMTEEVDELINLSLNKPLRLSADPSTKRPATLTEEVVRIRRMREGNHEAVLLALCTKTFTSKVIVFSGTKQAAHRLKIIFGLLGFKAAELHGNLTQAQRLDALELFRRQEVDFLIATDVAARGLDIIGVQTVINFACPRDLTSYVHRVGRTARAGREGYAVTFVTDNDRSLLKAIVKRAGSRLKSRIVAEQSITKWAQVIEQLEDQVSAVMQEEREEMALRKAEMEANKAENMIAHRDEIYSRPKRTWFVTEKEKKLVQKAAKENAAAKENGSQSKVMSAEQAEDLKMKEKRKREREKNLPRKKRRKLEAAREQLEDEDDLDDGKDKSKKEKSGISLVDLAYRRAKAVKAVNKAVDAGKIVRKAGNKPKPKSRASESRTEEMQDIFQNDASERKQRKPLHAGGKKKSSFKSKSRYKRR
ncbi:DEAD-box ATP-dependent RNA helicase 28 [Solanum pennellii]|uniref:DEAD-box ATP-dependent RNA helicase 28 n=1 Tax=Solanum pennellii TaxID=28526 RepID=A0ABM1GPK8_SOLPN|nr:DEAD-box ATP-dependent RNA helicase 28 [Solanum pennellii]